MSYRRDVGVRAIENLMQKRGKFDYILLETTGLADPGPIAAMFWLDDELGSEIYLDGKIQDTLLLYEFSEKCEVVENNLYFHIQLVFRYCNSH